KGLWVELSKQKNNAIFMMADSGSRGSSSNFSQLAGMRGLMSNTAGETIEVPVKANFREGLSVSEFFISTHGSRKGSTDTALKTAESGYLTRRLVDVSQSVVIAEEDDGSDRGAYYEDICEETDNKKIIVNVKDRALGRYAAKDVVDPFTGEIIVKRNEFINEEAADKIGAVNKKLLDEQDKHFAVCLRTALTCNSKTGISKKCYGRNLATNMEVEVGEAVGTIAAQSIGEPGTQLTMRTFHNGGVASGGDITQGLPRVQELFEARKPKGLAQLSEIDGKVISKEETRAGIAIKIANDTEEKIYTVDKTAEILVNTNQFVKRGQKLIRGSVHPKELLRILDAEAVQKYIIEEVQKVYCSQSVDISDKHIEIIVRQMMRKINVIFEGDTDLLPGRDVSIEEFKEATRKAMLEGKRLPVGKAVLLGITKAALGADSFLSAASFQETTRVLTQAAIQSKVDYLQGIKENVSIGGLIPAGTGILQEESFECEHRPQDEDDEDEEDNLDDVIMDEEDEDIEDDENSSIISADELNDIDD
ncbi:MAG: DNA-directed RNA polymerase subunit beta', partial [Acholeplasmatales bacterium]|nr:DNA-directed RNA polymerase subunit beta' [Acholeplasmatales bacterium]